MEWMTPALVASLDDYLRRQVRPEEYDRALTGILRLLADDYDYYAAMGWQRMVDKVLYA